MTRMFTIPGTDTRMKTWNVFVGCRYNCRYCSAKKLALTRLKNSPRYRDGFEPHYVPEEKGRKFKAGDFVFVAYMGDISFAPREVVQDILDSIIRQPDVKFLFCTKNPNAYLLWELEYPDNLYLGATIESNYDHGVTKAPLVEDRYKAMVMLQHPHKFISIEPLMDFHIGILVRWMKDIRPEIIEIGADNYHNHLPEPSNNMGRSAPWKVQFLLTFLHDICPNVIEKQGLQRLRE